MRRRREGVLGGHEAVAQQLRQVVLVVAGAPAELVAPGLQDAEDRALSRLLEGRVRGLRARQRRVGELRPVGAAQALHGGGEPVQELGEDSPGIAAGTVEGAVGGDAGGDPYGVGSLVPEPGGRGPERRRQIGARVGVPHREDVDAVQGLLLAHDGERAGAHDARERLSAQSHRVVGRVGHVRWRSTRARSPPSSQSRHPCRCVTSWGERADLLERLARRAGDRVVHVAHGAAERVGRRGVADLAQRLDDDHAQKRVRIVHGEAERLDGDRVLQQAEHVGRVLPPVEVSLPEDEDQPVASRRADDQQRVAGGVELHDVLGLQPVDELVQVALQGFARRGGDLGVLVPGGLDQAVDLALRVELGDIGRAEQGHGALLGSDLADGRRALLRRPGGKSTAGCGWRRRGGAPEGRGRRAPGRRRRDRRPPARGRAPGSSCSPR